MPLRKRDESPETTNGPRELRATPTQGEKIRRTKKKAPSATARRAVRRLSDCFDALRTNDAPDAPDDAPHDAPPPPPPPPPLTRMGPAAAPSADAPSSGDDSPAEEKQKPKYLCRKGCGSDLGFPASRAKHEVTCTFDPFALTDADSAKMRALKVEVAAVKVKAVKEDKRTAARAVGNFVTNKMEPYMKSQEWAKVAKKLPGTAGRFYVLCQYVDGKMGGLKEVTPAVLRGRAVKHQGNRPSTADLLARAANESHLGAEGTAAIAQASAADDALMADEAGNWAASIPFAVPNAPWAPTGATGFSVPVQLPADPAALRSFIAGQLDRVLEEARERIQDAPPYY